DLVHEACRRLVLPLLLLGEGPLDAAVDRLAAPLELLAAAAGAGCVILDHGHERPSPRGGRVGGVRIAAPPRLVRGRASCPPLPFFAGEGLGVRGVSVSRCLVPVSGEATPSPLPLSSWTGERGGSRAAEKARAPTLRMRLSRTRML